MVGVEAMTRYKILFTALFAALTIFIIPAGVHATAISMDASTLSPVLFVPGQERTFNFYVHGASLLEVKMEGNKKLVDSSTLLDPSPNSGPRSVSIRMKMPDEMPPGLHKMYLSATDISPKKGQINTVAKVMASIKVKVLSDYKKITVSVDAEDVSANDTTTIFVDVESWSNMVINSLFADVEIKDAENEKVGVVRTNVISLQPNEKSRITADFNTSGLPKGVYTLKATVYFDGNTTDAHGDFKIGDLFLSLKKYTKRIPYNKVGMFNFTLLNEWNKGISNVYSIINILGQSVKTSSENILGFSEKKFSTFLNAEGFELGNYSGTITAFYNGKNSTYPITVEIVNMPSAEENPSTVFSAFLSSPLILYLLLIILIIINIILLFKRKDSGKEKPPESPRPQ